MSLHILHTMKASGIISLFLVAAIVSAQADDYQIDAIVAKRAVSSSSSKNNSTSSISSAKSSANPSAKSSIQASVSSSATKAASSSSSKSSSSTSSSSTAGSDLNGICYGAIGVFAGCLLL